MEAVLWDSFNIYLTPLRSGGFGSARMWVTEHEGSSLSSESLGVTWDYNTSSMEMVPVKWGADASEWVCVAELEGLCAEEHGSYGHVMVAFKLC